MNFITPGNSNYTPAVAPAGLYQAANTAARLALNVAAGQRVQQTNTGLIWILVNTPASSPTNWIQETPDGEIVREDITALTGGASTCLDGQATTVLAAGTIYVLLVGQRRQSWQLQTSNSPTSVQNNIGVVQPVDYNVSTNAVAWVSI